MIGLPTETDEDVLGIVETGIRTMQHGKRSARGKAVDVTVSVSTHVPKPHTPFQWCAMDTLDEVDRKQRLLRQAAHGKRALKLRTHGSEASVLEGVFARYSAGQYGDAEDSGAAQFARTVEALVGAADEASRPAE